MKGISMFFTQTMLMATAMLFVACNKDSESNEADSASNASELILAGSDTEMPLVQDLVSRFQEKQSQPKEIKVEGGGSSVGIERFLKGEVQVANSSRPMWDEEIEQAHGAGLDPVPVVFGIDAVAMITNSRLGVDSLSLFQLRSIWRGEIKNWKELGGPDLEITLYGRHNTSGTYSYIKERVVQGDYCPSVKEQEGNSEIVEAVINDRSGIGYVGAGYLMDENGKPRPDLWACYIYIEGDKSYSPYEIQAVRNGAYPLTRPLFHYVNGKPTGILHDFFKFELSDEGQAIVKKFGYFPISDFYREMNRRKGVATR